MAEKKIGILMMAYGTPRSIEEIEPYYTHIRGGRKPSKELLNELIDRYERIWEINQFAEITDQQLEKVVDRLNERYSDVQFKGYLGLKHISPFIEDAVTVMNQDGINEAVSVVLAPHYSSLSVQVYNERAQKKANEFGDLRIYSVEKWYDHPLFIDFWAKQLAKILDQMSASEKEKAVVIFSAHSLPKRILASQDPYPQQLKETISRIAEKVELPNYRLGWQSAGQTPEPWLEPDIEELTKKLFIEEGMNSFIYCPIGFVAEHMEVLYDNDICCKAITDKLGAKYYRPEMPNTDPLFIECLAQVIEAELRQKGVIR